MVRSIQIFVWLCAAAVSACGVAVLGILPFELLENLQKYRVAIEEASKVPGTDIVQILVKNEEAIHSHVEMAAVVVLLCLACALLAVCFAAAVTMIVRTGSAPRSSG